MSVWTRNRTAAGTRRSKSRARRIQACSPACRYAVRGLAHRWGLSDGYGRGVRHPCEPRSGRRRRGPNVASLPTARFIRQARTALEEALQDHRMRAAESRVATPGRSCDTVPSARRRHSGSCLRAACTSSRTPFTCAAGLNAGAPLRTQPASRTASILAARMKSLSVSPSMLCVQIWMRTLPQVR